MQFRIKVKPKYKLGDRRVIRKFALFPVRITDSLVVWLERYWAKQELTESFWHDGPYRWVWETVDKSVADEPWSDLK